MAELGVPLLLNVLGHAGGTLIFAIFLVLLFSGRGWSGAQGRYLPALAAILALVWNLGSLLVLSWPAMPAVASGLVIAVSFSVLSLLPAVLLHLSLKDSQPALVASGYLLSSVAVGMRFWEVGTPTRRGPASYSYTTPASRLPCSFCCRTIVSFCWTRSCAFWRTRCWRPC
jgi:hypothetical protein